MKTNWKKRLLCWAIPLAVGGLAALLSGGMGSYKAMVRPPLSPPGWVFPVVWSILYLLMGEASWRVLESGADKETVRGALVAYGVQLALNFVWPLVFFGARAYFVAFILLVALWIGIFMTLRRFSAIDERAGNLLIPYLLWVTFAGYLNFGVFLLN